MIATSPLRSAFCCAIPAAAEGKMTDAHASRATAFTTAKCADVACARELFAGNWQIAQVQMG